METWINIIDDTTGKEEMVEFPPIENITIVNAELYNSFPTGFVTRNGEMLASGGQILYDDRGGKYSRDIYVRWDESGHQNKEPHINIDLFIRNYQTGRKKKISLKDFHLIIPGNLPRTIFIGISQSDGKSVIQPIVILPEKEDREYYKKQEEYLNKLKTHRLTENDKIEWKKRFDEYAKELKTRKNHI